MGEFPRRTEIGEILFQSGTSRILSPVNGIAYFDNTQNSVHLRIDGELSFRPNYERQEFTYLELKTKLDNLGILSLDFSGYLISELMDTFTAGEGSIVVFSPYTQEGHIDFHSMLYTKLKPEVDAFKSTLESIFKKSKVMDFITDKPGPYRYPDGNPRYFISKKCNQPLEKEFPHKNVLYLGPETLYHIIQALYYNIPFHERHLSVSVINKKGVEEGEARVFRVKNGTNLTHFFDTILKKNNYRYFTINSIYNKQPVFEIGAEFLFDFLKHHSIILSESKNPTDVPGMCNDCNDCSYFCPVSADPRALLDKDKSSFQKDRCLECGLCSVYCPVQIDFYELIKTSKKDTQVYAVS